MSSHTYHPDTHTHGLADDCPRCAEHAEHPHRSLDTENLAVLERRVRLGLQPRSQNEERAMMVLREISWPVGDAPDPPPTYPSLVCPNCGSEAVGSVERADIWQRVTFLLVPGATDTLDAQGREVEMDWHSWATEDAGEETTGVGWFCRGCVSEFPLAPLPFITPEEYRAREEET